MFISILKLYMVFSKPDSMFSTYKKGYQTISMKYIIRDKFNQLKANKNNAYLALMLTIY